MGIRQIILILVMVSCCTLPVIAQQVAVTEEAGHQGQPAIWGDWVVWRDVQQGPNNPADIYAKNLLTQEQLRLSSSGRAGGVDIYGNTVVWADKRSGDYDLFSYNLSTRIETALYVAPGDQVDPAIHGDLIVYRDGRGSLLNNIGMYSIASGYAQVISTEPGHKWKPDISSDLVVWGDYRSGDWDVYGYQIATGTEFIIGAGPDYQRSAATWGTTVVYENMSVPGTASSIGIYNFIENEHLYLGLKNAADWIDIYEDVLIWGEYTTGRGTNIYSYNLTEGTELAVCTASSWQYEPAIYAGTVVWSGDNGEDGFESFYNRDIFGTQLDPNVPPRDIVPPEVVSVTALGEALEVLFDEPLDRSSAEDVSHWSISDGISISSAVLDNELLTVTLATSPHAEWMSYELIIVGVADLAENPMFATVVEYTFDPCTAAPCGIAHNPSPAAGSNDLPEQLVLSWQAAPSATAHDVYLGTSHQAVAMANTASSQYMGAVLSQDAVNVVSLDANDFDPIQSDEISPLEDGLIGYWKFDESAGITAVDFSDAGNNGTLVNGPDWTVGKIGGALSFDGKDDYVDLAAQDIPAPWSVSCWVKREDSSYTNAVILESANYALKIEQYDNTNKVGFTEYQVADYSFNYEAPVGVWAHLVFVATASEVRLYADGNLVGVIAESIPCPMARISSFLRPLKGCIDEVRVYDRTLSFSEVSILYNHGTISGSTWPSIYYYMPSIALEPGQTYYWRIDEVNEFDQMVCTGDVWEFTIGVDTVTAVVDNMESYDPYTVRIWRTWLNPKATGAYVDLADVRWVPVHGGTQSMEYLYDNSYDYGAGACYSEIVFIVEDPCDWTADSIDALTLYYYGDTENASGEADRMYVGISDKTGTYVSVALNDTNDMTVTQWQKWSLDLADFNSVDLTSVATLHIGFGSSNNIDPIGGHGLIYFDDIHIGPYVEPCRFEPSEGYSSCFDTIVELVTMFVVDSPYKDNAPYYNGPVPRSMECLDVSGFSGVPDGELSIFDMQVLISQMRDLSY